MKIRLTIDVTTKTRKALAHHIADISALASEAQSLSHADMKTNIKCMIDAELRDIEHYYDTCLEGENDAESDDEA